jgi:[ribosomal protein S5]-alanine N-acetyltransferase
MKTKTFIYAHALNNFMLESEKLPVIEAARVRLRHLEKTDVDALFEIFSDAEAMRYWSSPAYASRAEAEKLLAEIHDLFEKKKLFQWGVALKSDDQIIGTTTLFHLDAQNGRAEIGYILNRKFWGNGYINEALTALLDFAFEKMNLRRIEADVDPRNAGSIRTLERLEFKREGFLRERWFVGGEIQDALFYGLLRREWKKDENDKANEWTK